MSNISDLSDTIIPKSDQLNADQLVAGSMNITVTSVTRSDSADQPVIVHYEGEAGRPFKPCKTMRKVLMYAWGKDGAEWAGRQMTLYNDPLVKFGGMDVGGIRISHLSHIERDIRVSLTSTKGKKALYEVKRMAGKASPKRQEAAQGDEHLPVTLIMSEQAEALQKLCTDRGVSVERVLRKAGVDAVDDIPAAKYAAALEFVKNAKPDPKEEPKLPDVL